MPKKKDISSLAYGEGLARPLKLPWLFQVLEFDHQLAIAIFEKDNRRPFSGHFLPKSSVEVEVSAAAQSAAVFISGCGAVAAKHEEAGKTLPADREILQKIADAATAQLREGDYLFQEPQAEIDLVAGYKASLFNNKASYSLAMLTEVFENDLDFTKGKPLMEFGTQESEQRIIFFSYCRGCAKALELFGDLEGIDSYEFIDSALQEAGIPDDGVKKPGSKK